MGKIIYLLRHAKSEPFGLVRNDYDRTLIPRGVAEARRTGTIMLQHEAAPDLMVSSAAPRAYYTMRIVATALGADPEKVLSDSLIYDGSPQTLLKIVQAWPDECEQACLCGHNPSISGLLSLLYSGVAGAMNTAEVAALELDTAVWKDAGHVPSKLLYYIQTNERQ